MAPQNIFDVNEKRNTNKDIVISGMSGQFPSSSNIDEFEYNLYNKIAMVDDSEIRYQHTHPLTPRLSGKIKDLSTFDSEFFGIPIPMANNMDPQARILLEEATKAVLDAGINPRTLMGTKTGVYIGSSMSETEELMYGNSDEFQYGITGCRKSMLASRISHYLGLTGPSLSCDTACSSSMYAFDLALSALKHGKIDAAIVGGSNLCLNLNVSLQFALLGVLSSSGVCRPFDADANGYCRSEAVGCLFLQRQRDAKRIYAYVIGSKTNCDGFKLEGITYPSSAIQEKLLKEIYASENIDCNEIGFIEAHSTATIAGDPEECKAIDNVIARNRRRPLPVGSVKSNCGHSEPAAGVCSIVKVLLAMNSGLIAPNINFRTIKSTIESLRSGRLSVITDAINLEAPFVGINSFGFGGANAHAILKQFDKPKTLKKLYNDLGNQLPRLITWSARTHDGVQVFFQNLEKHPLDFELLALAQNVQQNGLVDFYARGFAIFQPTCEKTTPKLLAQVISKPKKLNRRIIWIFSGIGAHWHTMGRSLLKLNLFQSSIEKLHSTLKPLGLDLRQILQTASRGNLPNILSSLVGVTAVQLALIDVLKSLGLAADFLIGQSIGEIACAYAVDCLTAEQAILVSYYCGKQIQESMRDSDSVVLVKAKLTEVVAICPKQVTVSGALSETSCVISGAKADVVGFVNLLKASNVYTEKLDDVDIALHSKQLTNTSADTLLSQLKKVVPQPKQRPNKWMSTSLPISEWLNENKRFASADYFVNNLQNRIQMEQILPYIPKDAVIVDFGPPVFKHSILEKNKMFSEYVKLIPADPSSDINSFLSAIGSLYLNGVDLDVSQLYPKIEFPVSRGTRCLSPLIKFDHSYKFETYNCEKNLEASGSKTFTINGNQHEWLMGHEIDGRVLLPATFYLECVWRTFSGIGTRTYFESFPVEFNNIKFERATTFTADSSIELLIVIHFGSGRFEITENNSLVVSGFVSALRQTEPVVYANNQCSDKAAITIHQEDFYKELKLRGYHYKGDFRGVVESSIDGSNGKIKWIHNWTTFMDCMLQMAIIGQDSRTLLLPTRIRRLRIYPSYHLTRNAKNSNIDVHFNSLRKRLLGGGIEIVGLDASAVSRRRSPADAVLEVYQFVSHFPAPKLSLNDIGRCCIQIILENQPKKHLQIVELSSNAKANLEFLKILGEAVSDLPLVTGSYALVHNTPKSAAVEDNMTSVDLNYLYMDDDISDLKPNLVVLCHEKLLQKLESTFLNNLDDKEFVIMRAQQNNKPLKMPENFEIIAEFPSEIQTFLLFQKVLEESDLGNIQILDVSKSTTEFSWIEELQKLCEPNTETILLSQQSNTNGVLGLTNCLRKEPETKNVRCVFIDDLNCPSFDLKLPIFANQLKKNLAINVYKEGCWGTYRHLKIKENYPVAQFTGHAYGHMSQIGDLHSLRWFEGPLSDKVADVKIVYSSLNFRDVMQASGRLPIAVFGKGRLNQACIFGFEYSGTDGKTGQRIMGMTTKGAVGSHLQDGDFFKFNVPENWTLEEAATVPVVYVTVYYALFYVADIRKGKSILIHAGSGGVGLAAIRVAQAYGLEVFTTVSTKEKREFLLKTFPTLKETNIGNSRDNSFEQMIMTQTFGKGVDFVLNSLSEEKLITSVRCLGKGGHFIEIGKYDMAADNPIEMEPFLQGISFSTVLADQLLGADEYLVEAIKTHVIQDIQKDIVKPLPVTVFQAAEIEPAFRYLMSGKHVGKVLLQIREDERANHTMPISVTPQIYFQSHEVYIVPGGLGGFGLELVDWMIIRGARKIVLSSSRGITSDYQNLRISLWKSYGCEIAVNTANIGSIDGCLKLIVAAMRLGPVGGIFNLAVVLKDSVFQNQTAALFQESFAPKAHATLYLDKLSRKLCPDLRYFVIFSSVSCGRGNAGQSNYGMANSIMERIIEDRVARGLPGKAIQWGAVGEVGLVADMAAGKIDLDIGGTLQQRISSCLQVLDLILATPDPIVSSMVVAEKKASATGQTILEFVLQTLSIRDIKTISMTAKLTELGLDSLTSVEIRQAFERDYGLVLNTADLRALTIEKLVELSDTAGVGKAGSVDKETIELKDYTEQLRRFYGQITEFWDVKGTLEKISHKGDYKKPIVVIPGIDGVGGKIWGKIGENLKCPAYVVKYHETSDATTLDEVVQFCYENVLKCLRLHGSETFQIIGYSMGCLLTHKVVAALESLGLQGKVIYIDGSPDFIQNLTTSLQSVYKGIEMEKKALSVILSLVLPSLALQTIEYEMRLKLNKEEIMTYIHDQLTEHKYEKINEMMLKVEGICQRLKMIKNPESYANIDIIDADLLLLKPTESTMVNFDDDYGLSLLTRCQLKTKVLEGDHQTILYNDSLSSIINEFLSD